MNNLRLRFIVTMAMVQENTRDAKFEHTELDGEPSVWEGARHGDYG